MATYVAFLRAINLGRTRQFPKDAIRAAVEAAGCTDVETYINTGNVRFRSSMRSRARVEAALERAFLADRGFAVPTVVLTPAELVAVAEDAAGLAHEGRHYVSLLKDEPQAAAVATLEAIGGPGERVRVRARAAHLLVDEGVEAGRLTNAAVERHLGVATNRNLTVIRTLADRWGTA